MTTTGSTIMPAMAISTTVGPLGSLMANLQFVDVRYLFLGEETYEHQEQQKQEREQHEVLNI